MNQIVFALHALIVLAVPCLFGWVLLRRAVREHDLLVLIPGAVVVGSLSLMALLNELRFFLEMPVALWTGYKILLLLTVCLGIFGRPPRRHPLVARPARGFLPLGLLGAAALLVGCYFGVPAFSGILNDAWWFHYPEANFIQTIERFPLMHVFAPDDMLYYHYGPDLLAAAWSFVLEQPVAFGFALNIVVFTPATLLLGYAIMLRVTRNSWAALASALFIVVGGNLRFLSLLTANWHNPAEILQALNSQTVEGMLEMVFTPSHALGVPAVLVGILLFRHFTLRPSWSLGVLLGLWTGMLTLLAEWYFFPFFGAVGIWAVLQIWRLWGIDPAKSRHTRIGVVAVPLLVSLGWGLFNNTYLAGAFGHFWLRPGTTLSATTSRVANLQITQAAGAGLAGEGINMLPHLDRFHAPQLVPVTLNRGHLGKLPSWEKAGSKGGTLRSMFSPAILAETFPVLGLGLAYGVWLWTRRRQSTVFILVIMGLLSVLPPVFLDWGYRSTDFLRFFTGAFCWAALLTGALVGRLWAAPSLRARASAVLLTGAILTNAVGLGVAGLLPGTMATVKAVSSSASSLSEVASPGRPDVNTPDLKTPNPRKVDTARHLEKLSQQADAFLFPLTKGRERALFIVPDNQLPPQEKFPEWMKLASFARITIPVGRHWNDSSYAQYYRRAMNSMEAEALAALDVHWILVSNLYGDPTDESARALADPVRFRRVTTFYSGQYFLAIYRVL